MTFIDPAIFILLFAILSVPVANRFHLPFELFLVFGSCILSLSPWAPTFQLDPRIVFELFLPPILFYAAYFTSWREFKFNFRPISLLAVGLVTFTMTIVAIISKIIFPDFTWAEGFLLGAIVSPTDATSATTMIKKLGAPHRIITILEGESMVNDAAALILYRFSLAAILSGSFSLSHVTTQFIFDTSGGVALGLIIGVVSIYLLPKIESVTAETTFTIITAFACYLAGEHLGVSGVITTVVCGIYCGIRVPVIATSQTRITAKASWSTLIFIINGFVFTLIGLELPTILKNLQTDSLEILIGYGALISLCVMLARIIWVFPMAYLPRLFSPSIARRDPMPSWKILFILSWSGMRGIVSFAAALSIPFLLSTGQAFPHRDLILFITYCVIVFTLIIPTITLPIILHYLKIVDEKNEIRQEAIARIRSLENSITHLKDLGSRENISDDVLNGFLKQLDRRLNVVKTQINESPFSTLSDDHTLLKKLTLLNIECERKTLLELRKSGEIYDEVFHQLSDELDIEELRANSVRI